MKQEKKYIKGIASSCLLRNNPHLNTRRTQGKEINSKQRLERGKEPPLD